STSLMKGSPPLTAGMVLLNDKTAKVLAFALPESSVGCGCSRKFQSQPTCQPTDIELAISNLDTRWVDGPWQQRRGNFRPNHKSLLTTKQRPLT
ncbi:MAG: hypothetical protein VX636_00745, partial [Cyanobacteriota bacterium]|nr:hypothetical protein [Cyanobacteriota bacterium]